MDDNFCNKCGMCCKYIKANFDTKTLFWDGISILTDDFAEMLINVEGDIYTCKYLKDTLCTNPNKPQICLDYPASPFVELPDKCGYSGKIFMQNEKVRQKIRKLKEEIIHYEAVIKTTRDKREIQQLQKIIASHQKFIDRYKEYGANDW